MLRVGVLHAPNDWRQHRACIMLHVALASAATQPGACLHAAVDPRDAGGFIAARELRRAAMKNAPIRDEDHRTRALYSS